MANYGLAPFVRASLALLSLSALLLPRAAALGPGGLQLHDLDARQPYPNCLLVGDETQRALLLKNGAAEDMIEVSLFAPTGLTDKDFEVIQSSSNNLALAADDSDTIVSPWISDTVEGGTLYNFTITFEFDKCPGKIFYDLRILNKKTQTAHCELEINFLLAGLCAYGTEAGNNNIFLTGRAGDPPQFNYEDINADLDRNFQVYIMFPDGTDSSRPLQSHDLSQIQVTPLAYHEQVKYDFTPDACDIGAGVYDYANSVVKLLKSGCQMGFAQNPNFDGSWDGLHFGANFEPNRAGEFGFQLVWEEFTEGSEFEEIYETFFLIKITGKPPPTVVKVDPVGPFSPDGGEEFEVTLYNLDDFSDIVFKVQGDSEPFKMKDGSFREVGNYTYKMTFTTTPGSGINLPWELIVTGKDGTQIKNADYTEPPFLFSYYTRPIINSISPASGSEVGDTVVTVTGTFTNFDPSKGDGILFDNMLIDSSLIDFPSESQIIFKTPPRPGKSFEVSLSIVADGLKSDPVTFTYLALSLDVTIVVTGASFQDGKHIVGSCTPTTYTAVPSVSGDLEFTYLWSVVRGDVSLLQDNDIAKGSSVTLDEDFFSQGDYTVSVTVEGKTTKASGTATIDVVKRENLLLGVSIIKPVARTRSKPDTPLRIHANVEIPSCYSESAEIEYEWTYRGRSILMSFANETTEDRTKFTPTKLGREYLIAQNELVAGQSTPITVKASVVSNPAISGTATQFITIMRADLIAIIGSGEYTVEKSVLSPMQMTCGYSHDPDVRVGDATAGLTYTWSCLESTSTNFSDATPCRAELLPSTTFVAFDITAATAGLYAKYECSVAKEERTSKTSQIVNFIGEERPVFSVQLVDSSQKELDINAVPYYEDVIMLPVVDENTTVRYRVLAPTYQRATLLSPDNLLPPPSYWQADSVTAKALPLGFRGMSLDPNTEYQIEILYSSRSTGTEGTSILQFTTIEKPRLILLPLVKNKGVPYELFTVQAMATIDSAEFVFRFYLIDPSGTSFCVGCEGSPVVTFSMTEPGLYSLRAELWDARGNNLIDSRDSTEKITIEAASPTVRYANRIVIDRGTAANALETAFHSGDHNGFQRTLFQLARQYYSLQPGQEDDSDRLLLKGAIEMMRQITAKAVPSSADGSNMAATCSALLRLDSHLVEDRVAFFDLMKCMLDVCSATPATERLAMAASAQAALNFSLTHAVDRVSEGSTRLRLVREVGEPRRTELLHVYETMIRMNIECGARDEYCGYEKKTSSVVDDGLGFAGVADVQYALRVVCNSDAEMALEMGSDKFAWCIDAVPQSGERTFFSAARTDDFVRSSLIQGENKTDSEKLLLSHVFKFADGKAVDGAVVSTDCYTTTLTMAPTDDPSLNAVEGYLYSNRVLELDVEPVPFESYARDTSGAGVTASVLGENGVATFTSSRPGLGGAIYTAVTATPKPDNANSNAEGLNAGGLVGIFMGVLVFIIIAVLVAWLVATRCLLIAAAPPPPLEPDETYVERDVYGRSVWAEDYAGEGGDDAGMM